MIGAPMKVWGISAVRFPLSMYDEDRVSRAYELLEAGRRWTIFGEPGVFGPKSTDVHAHGTVYVHVCGSADRGGRWTSVRAEPICSRSMHTRARRAPPASLRVLGKLIMADLFFSLRTSLRAQRSPEISRRDEAE